MLKIFSQSIKQIRSRLVAKPYLHALRRASSPRDEVGLIIFSYDRPMQLQALLQSIVGYWPEACIITVLYRTSSEPFSRAYRSIFELHQHVTAIPESDFKSQLIQSVDSLHSKWTCLMVDDDILVRPVGTEIVPWLESGHVFSLRLGSHITNCQPLGYVRQNPVRLKASTRSRTDFISWKWHGSTGDWEMPFSLDGNIVNRAELLYHLRAGKYSNPNTLEGALMKLNWTYTWESGAAYEKARLVNVPMNRVQESDLHFPSMDLSKTELLKMWKEGLRPNFTEFSMRTWPSCHIEILPQFEKSGSI